MKLKITHRPTGLTLRQFVKDHEVTPINNNGRSLRPADLLNEKIRYCLSEDGSPGFYYHVPWQGSALFFLDKGEFVVTFGQVTEPQVEG